MSTTHAHTHTHTLTHTHTHTHTRTVKTNKISEKETVMAKARVQSGMNDWVAETDRQTDRDRQTDGRTHRPDRWTD